MGEQLSDEGPKKPDYRQIDGTPGYTRLPLEWSSIVDQLTNRAKWLEHKVTTQAAELAELREQHYLDVATINGLRAERVEEFNGSVWVKKEEIERLRQSTLTAELLEEVRDIMLRVIPYVGGRSIGDAFHPYLAKIDAVLSKLPPAPAQKEEST